MTTNDSARDAATGAVALTAAAALSAFLLFFAGLGVAVLFGLGS